MHGDPVDRIVCALLDMHDPDVAGSGWQPLDDPDPLRGIAHLVARFAAAFVLDPSGLTRTKALGTERTARRLQHALPGGDSPPRAAVAGHQTSSSMGGAADRLAATS